MTCQPANWRTCSCRLPKMKEVWQVALATSNTVSGRFSHFATEAAQNALPNDATNRWALRIGIGMKPAMEQRMQETLYHKPSLCGKMAPFKPIFKLFIACEDHAAFLQAKRVQDQLEMLCGKDFEITCEMWNFALLRHERLREYAVKEAAEAEMIVISLRCNSELPPHVKCLMESLPARSQAGQAALVALLGPKKLTRMTRHPHLVYLRQIAESLGLDFFCNQNGPERMDFSQPAFRSTDGWTIERSLISHHAAWSAGGIND